MAQEETGHWTAWTTEDERQLRAHSQARTPLPVIAKKMQRTRGRSGERREFSASPWVIAALAASEMSGGIRVTRDEHLAWCKRRALEYVDAGDLTNAVANMGSELKQHPDTDNPALNGLVTIGMMYVTDGDNSAVRRWIEGFR